MLKRRIHHEVEERRNEEMKLLQLTSSNKTRLDEFMHRVSILNKDEISFVKNLYAKDMASMTHRIEALEQRLNDELSASSSMHTVSEKPSHKDLSTVQNESTHKRKSSMQEEADTTPKKTNFERTSNTPQRKPSNDKKTMDEITKVKQLFAAGLKNKMAAKKK
jgi:Ni,Fe-hydrogenase I large subunit